MLLICFIASTVTASLFFGLEPSEKVTLIRLDAFKGPLEKVRPYSIELLVREPLEEVVVEFSYLVRVNEENHELLMATLDPEEILDSSGEKLTAVPKVAEILRMMEPFPDRPSYRFFKDSAEYKDQFREVEYDLAVLDIRDFLKYLPKSAGPQAYGSYMVYATLLHKENASFYEGASDYYLNRLDSMGEVVWESNDGSHLVENPNVIVPRSSEYVHIREAPSFGTVVFEDVEAEETLRVYFTTRHLAGPAVLVVRIWADGEVQENYYSFVGWPEREY